MFERLRESLDLVEATMRRQLVGESDFVAALGEYILTSGGKRLRPVLVVLSAELCGYTGPRRIEVGGAIELLHTATLLHDDVVDFGQMRRGRPSANAIWGNRRVVLGGDFFYARACAMIVEDGDIELLRIIAQIIRLLSEGELIQLQRSFDAEVSEAHYYKVIERKSASLLSGACEMGAVLGGVTRGEQRRVAEFGRELGVAFQLRDDALDYEAGEAELGKRPYDDLREGKVTLPLLLTLKRCTGSEREKIVSFLKTAAQIALENPADDEALESAAIAEVIGLVDRYHGIADTVRRAEEHVQRAAEAIAPFSDGLAKQELLEAAAYSVSRGN